MNIAIVGANHSRNIFLSENGNNRDDYNVVSYFHMTSIMSIMSKSIDYDYERMMQSDLNDNQIDYWYNELEKNYLRTLESKKPDVILMDFYADARYGVRSYGREYVIDRLLTLKGKEILQWNKFGIVYNSNTNKQYYIMMWKNRFDRFMDFLHEKLPNVQLIINTAKASNFTIDQYGKHYVPEVLKDINIDEINDLWKIFDNYAIKEYGLQQLNLPQKYILQNGNGIEPTSPIDFEAGYYTKSFKEFEDIKQDNILPKRKTTNVNLICDSEFSKKMGKWTNMAGSFKVKEKGGYTYIRPIDCRAELGKYRPQAWSRPAEINGDGVTEYCLSFYIKIDDLSLVQNDTVVFGIRTFNHARGIKAAEAVEEYRLTLKGHKLHSGKEYRYVFKFTPVGRYIKVAPFLFEYLHGIEYSRIKLECASEVSEYTK